MSWSWLGASYHDQIVAPGKQPVFLLLVGLLAGFGFIRTSTRLIRAQVRWWPGNVSAVGVHLHHEFFGVLIMLVSGTLGFAVRIETAWRDVLALCFGIGAGLVLDEFALLLHLQDVYWSKEGRTSIDAVILAVTATGLLLVGGVPFGAAGIGDAEASARWTAVALVCLNACFTVVTALKGKLWLALLSVPVGAIGVVGALRLGYPNSPWGRRRYAGRPATLERATRRGDRWNRRKSWLVTAIGGAPSQADPSQADPSQADPSQADPSQADPDPAQAS